MAFGVWIYFGIDFVLHHGGSNTEAGGDDCGDLVEGGNATAYGRNFSQDDVLILWHANTSLENPDHDLIADH